MNIFLSTDFLKLTEFYSEMKGFSIPTIYSWKKSQFVFEILYTKSGLFPGYADIENSWQKRFFLQFPGGIKYSILYPKVQLFMFFISNIPKSSTIELYWVINIILSILHSPDLTTSVYKNENSQKIYHEISLEFQGLGNLLMEKWWSFLQSIIWRWNAGKWLVLLEGKEYLRRRKISANCNLSTS